MSNYPDLDRIDDEDALESLINQTEDLELKRRIRRRQRNIREKRLAEYEANRVVRLVPQSDEDATQLRLRRAQEDKQRKLRDLEEQARQRQTGTGAEDLVRQRQAEAELEKQRKLEGFREMGKILSSVYNTGVNDILAEKNKPAKDDVNSANFMRNDVRGFKDSGHVLGFGGTSYGSKAATPRAQDAIRGGVTHNPTAIKQILLDWSKAQVAGYDNVNVTNFSSSWSDGLAFCALIHHFYPDAFDFKKLNPKNRRSNFTLAFTTAEKLADIYPVLDVEDMVHMKNPDWKCVFTYVQGFYRRFAQEQK